MNQMQQAAADYSAALADRLADLAGGDIPWLISRRMRAAARLAEAGFPDIRQERWRHTNVEPIFEHHFEPAPKATADPEILPGLPLDDPRTLRLVLVNGYFAPALSRLHGLPAEVTLTSSARLLEQAPERLKPYLDGTLDTADGFGALNAAYSGDGAFLHLPAGIRLDRPVDLVYLALPDPARPLMILPHALILLEAGAEAQVSERFVSLGDAPYLTVGQTQMHLGDGAQLRHYCCQQEALQGYHMGRLQVRLGGDARYEGYHLALGGRIARSEIELSCQGPGASGALHGLALAHDGQLVDFHTDVIHAVPACTTRQRFKAILSGRGRGVFRGAIRVDQDAQGSDAHLRSDNLLLSRHGEVNVQPHLEIHADAVQCGHGTTVGQLDPTALFYLRSRGIPEPQARHLLIQGFAVDLLDAMGDAPQRRWMEAALNARLETLHV